jgi:GNAT superfamily N-acetyltransferase|tara:strand:- start:572 stop:931 length:360 start_codon:yes stop_codon:yes gene_type:complete
MELVPITEEYYDFVRVLRNTQPGFLVHANITPEHQEVYMNKYGKNYYICLLYKKPVGFIGVVDEDIRLCTHPSAQGKGIGTFMLKEIVKLYPNATGKILEDNIPSQKAFEKANVPYTLI